MIARCPSRRMYSPITQSSYMVLDKRKNDYVFNTRWLSYASSYEIWQIHNQYIECIWMNIDVVDDLCICVNLELEFRDKILILIKFGLQNHVTFNIPNYHSIRRINGWIVKRNHALNVSYRIRGSFESSEKVSTGTWRVVWIWYKRQIKIRWNRLDWN